MFEVELKRKDPQYIDIEEFNYYELRSCVAYEMAIRNEEFRTQLLKIVSYHNEIFINYQKETIIREEDKKNKDLYYNCGLIKGPNSEKNFFNILKEISLNSLNSELRVLGIMEDALFEIIKIKEIQHFEIIKYLKNIYNPEKLDLNNEEVNRVVTDSFVLSQKGPIDDETYILRNEVIPNFQRPFLKFRDSKHAYVSLNFSLEKEELENYISHISKTLIEEKLIKTPSEIMKLNKEEMLAFSEIKKRDSKLIADYFFCYDYYKEVKNKYPQAEDIDIIRELDLEFLNHYDSIKDNYRKDDTYKKSIIPLMQKLIDEKGYLQSVT